MVTDKNQVASFFNGLAQDYYDKRYSCLQDINSFSMRHRLHQATLLLDRYAPRPGKFLDLGCGPANFFEIVQARGYDYYGIDISAGMIKQAQRRVARLAPQRQVTLLTGDVCHTSLPDHFFEVAVALGLMDYLPEEVVFYQELYRLLRPGGVALLSYCHQRSFYHLSRRLLRPFSRLLNPGNRVLGSFQTRAHTAAEEIDKLTTSGFCILELVFLGAHLIPFNLPVPKFYFQLLGALERCWQRTSCQFGFSSFIIVAQKSEKISSHF